MAEGQAPRTTRIDVVTLTYAPNEDRTDPWAAHEFMYPHVKLYLARLRKRFGKKSLRYFCVGEYGSKKGRVHWHIIMFWQRGAEYPWHMVKTKYDPPKPGQKAPLPRKWIPEWPHGHVAVDERAGTAKALRYVCKYLVKDIADKKSRCKMTYSTRPALGHGYFVRLALEHVKAGLAPQDGSYRFDDWKYFAGPKKGARKPFFMQIGAKRRYCAAYVRLWNRIRFGEHMPPSDMIEEYEDSLVEEIEDGRGIAGRSEEYKERREQELAAERSQPKEKRKEREERYPPTPWKWIKDPEKMTRADLGAYRHGWTEADRREWEYWHRVLDRRGLISVWFEKRAGGKVSRALREDAGRRRKRVEIDFSVPYEKRLAKERADRYERDKLIDEIGRERVEAQIAAEALMNAERGF